jgi:(p)ppGpp synthase/HD superfamily hydrolase
MTNIRRQPRIKAMRIALMAMLALNGESFALKSKRARTEMSSVLYYRTADDSVVNTIQPDDLAATVLVRNPLLQHTRVAEVFSKMPSWLRVQRSHLMERNLDALKENMRSSLYTENEVSKLMFAIEEASLGNRNIMAGAAEFCLILTETMDMGLNTLIAAAFHYCSCVEAREESVMNTCVSFGVWDPKEHRGLKMFGDHVVEIARDAARLKKMEMVFGSIVQNPGSSVRLSLDSKDADNLRKLLLTDTKDWRALAIRSAACLFRLRGIEMSGRKGLSKEAIRASREALYIFAPLASRLGMHRLKNELEGAAFRTLYRRQYETVTSLARQMRYKKFGRGAARKGVVDMADVDKRAMNIGESMKCVLESVQKEMEHVLANDPVFAATTLDFHVAARVKEPYSLWRKMLRNHADHVLQVPDALALRIVLNAKKMSPDEPPEVTSARERALCYYAQQLCTRHWTPIDGSPRFKDYIERPKPNGYQSLHYTAITEFENQDWTLEIQIRTGEMHKVAEFGLASHWDYKAKNKPASDKAPNYSSDSYLRSVQEWHWQHQPSSGVRWSAKPASEESESFVDDLHRELRAERIEKRTQRLAPYLEALNAAQSDLARDHVFVFVSQSEDTLNSKGNIMSLPSGACVLDALRQGERSSGLNLDWRGSPSLNGSATNLTRKLRNGDILTLPIRSASLLSV